jgi:hypothetical protein
VGSQRELGDEAVSGLGDVLVERELTREEVIRCLCELFSIAPAAVFVSEALEEILAMPEGIRVLCSKSSFSEGEFRTLLSFHEGDFMSRRRLEMATRLCQLLNCRCLVSDGEDNPYSVLLVCPSGSFGKALLKSDCEKGYSLHSVDHMSFPL